MKKFNNLLIQKLRMSLLILSNCEPINKEIFVKMKGLKTIDEISTNENRLSFIWDALIYADYIYSYKNDGFYQLTQTGMNHVQLYKNCLTEKISLS